MSRAGVIVARIQCLSSRTSGTLHSVLAPSCSSCPRCSTSFGLWMPQQSDFVRPMFDTHFQINKTNREDKSGFHKEDRRNGRDKSKQGSSTGLPGVCGVSSRSDAISLRIANHFGFAEGNPPMLLPRMRFTVRGLMIAIAVMAIALGVGIEVMRLKRFRDQFLAKAKEHEAWAAMYSNWEEHEHRMAAIEQEFAARWSKHLDRQKRLVDKSRSPEIEDRVDESTKRLRTFAEARERDALEREAGS